MLERDGCTLCFKYLVLMIHVIKVAPYSLEAAEHREVQDQFTAQHIDAST